MEDLFDQQRDDPAFLENLIAELSERKVARAQALRQRAVQAIGTIRKPLAPVATAGNQNASPAPSPQAKSNSTASSSHPSFKATPPPQLVTPMRGPPRIENKASDILSAWTAIEVLSPPAFRKPEDLVSFDRYRIASIESGKLPWEDGGEKSRPNQKLYYQVILGTIDLERTTAALLQVYTDSRAERPSVRGEAVLATIMVDKEGRPVETDAVAISSFGWGVPVALSGGLHSLGRWPQVEKDLVDGAVKKVVLKDRNGEVQPLTSATINAAYAWLLKQIGIDAHFLRPPSFAVRSYQYFKIQDPPESILLNSFYLDDLAKAKALVDRGAATPNLMRYLGITKPASRRNLMKDNKALAHALEPKKFPLGSWPGMGRHPLALLQQCAVNLALDELKTDGILAVNGPPGTGKTTLLRDAVAAVVTKRAEVLCAYDDPETAFIHSGQKLRKGNAFVHLYRLDEKLRGFEIVVASSNNKAVENVSAELPATEAVATDASLRYFRTVSDALLQRRTWGVAAAVLGNARNRSEFRQTFWWDEDCGMQRYLQEASGNPQFITEITETGTRQRKPRVIIEEKAPADHEEAVRRWKTARTRFRKAISDCKATMNDLQSAHELLIGLPQKQAALAEADRQITEAQGPLQSASAIAQGVGALHDSKSRDVEAIGREADTLLRIKPGFWSRLFGTARYLSWRSGHEAVSLRLAKAKQELDILARDASVKKAEHADLHAAFQRLLTRKADLSAALQADRQKLGALRQRHPGVFITDEFFALSHQQKQKTAPWLDKVAARLRNAVFEAAMELHRAFIDAAAKPVRHNLNVLMDGFGTRSLGSPEKDALIPHLWSTFFLMVPVVSTTFASVSRMFARIGPDDLGWLFVDEAGQALPQAAVGALLRTQRALVVGDPIQIEPVVVLPDQLTEAICGQFGIDALNYNAPGASVQTLADSATAYFGTFETKFGTREVGVPLLVHRRCTEPMFGISNSIAYENLMVQAKQDKASPIRDVLGPSRWIHIEGQGQEKWCQNEGEAVLGLVRALRQANCKPDFYIVTPFVVVQDRMRAMLRSSGLLDGWVDNPHQWVYERIGTVHTVQGREAEAVFLILGAPDPQQRGARGWAGGRPNLLNVAVTRAKEAIFVIGNRSLWKSAGVFQTLDAALS